MKYFYAPLLLSAILLLACNNEKPISRVEATNQEAIYNVLFNDNARLNSLEFFDSETPDTAAFIAHPDSIHHLFWHQIDATHDTLVINISSDPVPSPVGLVYQASVNYTIRYTGTFHTMRFNAGADSIERYSKAFTLNGLRTATCQQWGMSNQVRRGWLLTDISDARFYSGDYHFLNAFLYSTTGHPADTNFIFGPHDPAQIVSFNRSEQMTVHFNPIDSTDLILIYIPHSDFGYQLAPLQEDSLGNYSVVFNMPSRKIYGQLRFLVINAGSLTGAYRTSGYSFNYQTR